VTPPQLAALDGPANFRDLGGYPTRGGGRTRLGRVFRSDSLSFLSERDVVAVRDRFGVRTVIDLRAGHEVDEHGHGPIRDHVRHLHLPIVDQTREPPRAQPGRRFESLDQIYAFMLDEYAERFGRVLRAVGDPDLQPLVFHCAAGKDRTGLVAALTLALCGVPDEHVVTDFAFTESRMPEIVARHTARAGRTERDAEVAGQEYGAQGATMMAVLDALRVEHGSVAGYAEATGLTGTEVARLRASLVDPRS